MYAILPHNGRHLAALFGPYFLRLIAMTNAVTSTKDRAMTLLGKGLSTSVVASALGVTDGAISQLLADPIFAAEVQKLRFASLTASSELDDRYNDMEGKLLTKLERNLPLIQKPREILQAINVVNGAKRRGAGSADPNAITANIVQISVPAVIHNKFVTNVNNQIVEVRDGSGSASTLVTISADSLDRVVREKALLPSPELPESGSAGLASEGSGESSGSERKSALADAL